MFTSQIPNFKNLMTMRQLFVHFVHWITKSRMSQFRNTFAMLLFVLPMFCGNLLAQQFTISQIPATAVVGDIVDLDVTISNADSMVSFQYTHEWDSTRIRFIGQNSTNLPSASGFAVFQPQEDKLTVSWNNTNGRFDNITPAGNATATRIIYKLRFLIRSLSPAPWLRFTGDPTPVDLTRSGGRSVIPTFSSLGTPPFVNYAALNINTISQSVQPGQQVCIDVTAQNFNNIVKAQWGMKWDSSVLRFESVSTAGLPNTTSIANSNFNTVRAVTNGELGFSWTPASAGSRTVTDGTVLFKLCFTAIGANGTSSLLRTLSLTDSPIEVIRYNVIDANQRVPLTPQNGTVAVSTTGGGVPIVGLGFLADQISATTGSEIGVRIRTVNFQSVAAAQWSMHFDSTKLTYLGVCPMPTGICDGTETWELPGLTADNFFSPTSGTLRFAWFSLTARNVAKPDSTTLFTIRFRVTGAACTNSPVTFNGTPLRVLITDEAGATRTQTFVSGNVSVPCSAAAIVASGSTTNATCNGGGNGAITLTVSGGTGTFTYAWTGPNGFTSAVQNPTNLRAGTYNVVITSGTQTNNQSFVVTEPTIISGVQTITNVACFGASTGAISVATTGGAGSYTYSWTGPNSFTSLAQNITGLATGSYVFTIRDGAGCSVTSLPLLVSQPASALAVGSPTVVNVGCFGGNNGTISVAGTGGTAPYSYSWTGTNAFASTSQNISNLSAGNYTVTVRDANGCTVSSTAISVAQPASLPNIGSPTVTNLTCGGTTGSISIVPSGGTAPYSYSWTGPNSFAASTQNISNLSAGDYTVVIRDANGCSMTSGAITVTQPASAVSIGSTSVTNIPCFGGNTGAVNVTIAGGVAPYVYSWTGPNSFTASTLNISNLLAGSYTLNIRDGNGCSITSQAIVVMQPTTALTIGTPSVQNIACFGNSTGGIVISPSGGTSPYMYMWTGVGGFTSAFQSVSNLVAGNYTVVVRDANNCTATSNSISVTQPTTPPSIGTPSVTNVACVGTSTGGIVIVPSGGMPSYTYSWAGPNGFTSTSQNISNLSAGDYIVTIRDANGCSVISVNIPVTQPTNGIAVGSPTVVNVACFGGSTGGISISPSGGTAPFTYSWTGTNGFTSSNQNISSLSAGSYTVVVRDANGCTVTSNAISITQPLAVLAVGSPTVVNVGCFGGSTGGISISPSGGTAPFTYSWTGTNGFTSSNQNISSLSAGSYTVVVRDANGCTASSNNIAISQPANGIAVGSPTVVNVGCFGGSTGGISISPSGGTAPFTYSWTGTNGFTSSNQNISSLSTGSYTVVVRDANGCTVTSNAISVTAPLAAISIGSTPTAARCNGGSTGAISIVPSGGTPNYTYSWSGVGGFVSTNQNLSNLRAGSYIVTVSDQNGCTQTSTPIVIGEPSLLTISSPTITAARCGQLNGSISVNVSGGTGGYAYLWSNASTNAILSNVGAGQYSVVVTDGNGCTMASTNYTVTSSSAAFTFSTLPTVTNATCGQNNGAISSVSITGGVAPYTYSWAGPNGFTSSSQNLSSLSAGNYILIARDGNGCETVLSAINVASAGSTLSIGTPAVTNVVCNGGSTGSISVTVSGGVAPLRFSWTGTNGFTSSNQNLTGLSAGTYSLVVTDANGCTASSNNIAISQPATAITVASQPTTTSVKCFGGNDGAISVAPSGGTGGYTYTWSQPSIGNTANATGLTAGTYGVTVRDANGCQVSATGISVAQPALPLAISFMVRDANGAANGEIDVTVTGGTQPYRYAWTAAGVCANCQNPRNLAPGTYTVVVTDANNCTTTQQIQVRGTTVQIVLTNSTVSNAACVGSNAGGVSITFVGGTAPFVFEWRDSARNVVVGTTQNLSDIGAGTYNLRITDALGQIFNSPTYSVLGGITPVRITTNTVGNETCAELGRIDISISGGTGSYSILWNNGNTSEDLTNLRRGAYSVTVRDNAGCTATANFTVNYVPCPLVVTRTVRNLRCAGDNTGAIVLTIGGGDPVYRIRWSGARTDSAQVSNAPTRGGVYEIANLPAGSYSIRVIDANGQEIVVNEVITEPNPIRVVGTIAPDNGACNGSVTLTVSGGTGNYSYLWSDNSTGRDIFNLCGNITRTVTVRDERGCIGTATFTIPRFERLRALDTTIIAPRCSGDSTGSIRATWVGGTRPFTFLWRNEQSVVVGTDSVLTRMPSGRYFVTVTDRSTPAQTFTAIFVIASPTNPLIITDLQLSSATPNNADGGAVVIVSGGTQPYSFTWCNGNNTGTVNRINNLRSGVCGVTVTDAQGCRIIRNFDVTIGGAVSIVAVSDYNGFNIRCNGQCNGSAIVQGVQGAVAPLTYRWSSGETSAIARALCGGLNSVTITDANGRNYQTTITLTEPLALQATLLKRDPTSAGGKNGSITVNVTGGVDPYKYRWNDPTLPAQSFVGNVGAGRYFVLVTDKNGCEILKDAILKDSSNGTTCLTASPIITPNDDGKNDIFEVNLCGYSQVKLEIYNRFGQLEYEDENYANNWTGLGRNGKQLPNGGYFYILKASTSTGSTQLEKGTVTIMREER